MDSFDCRLMVFKKGLIQSMLLLHVDHESVIYNHIPPQPQGRAVDSGANVQCNVKHNILARENSHGFTNWLSPHCGAYSMDLQDEMSKDPATSRMLGLATVTNDLRIIYHELFVL